MNNEYTPSNGLTASPFAPAARGTAPATTYAYDGAHHSTAHTAQPNAPQHAPAARPGPQYAPAPQAPHAGPPAPTQPPHASPAAPTSAAGAVPAHPAPDAPVPTAAVPAASTSAPGTAAPVISARSVTKTYGPNTVLRGVSLDIYPGESVAIMGPSGSGKTTLLHALAGIITMDSGSVHITTPHPGAGPNTVDLSSLTEKQRTALRAGSFGFIFQQGLLVPELTTEENVALAAMLAGGGRAQARVAAVDLLTKLGLGDKLQCRIGELSGGQAQRVAIARSQVTGAPITFADEPTGALDTTTAHEVMALLLALIPQQGKTLVIVTHDPNIAAQCSRTIHLLDGQIVHDSQHPAQPRQEGTH
mgnify:CR=1 FL=1